MKKGAFDTAKKCIAMLLAATVTASVAGTTVMAAEPTAPEYIDIVAVKGHESFISSHMDMIKAVQKALLEHQSVIDISSYRISSDYSKDIYTAITAICPEMFFVERTQPFSSYALSSAGYITKLYPNYLYNKTTTDKMLKEFYAEADYYLDQVSGQLSACQDEFSKVMVLHDELVLDASYSASNPSTYVFMTDKYGVCENYARVYAYLLSQLGIYSEVIDSYSMGHEWLKVRIDGTYYQVDVTWDDPRPDRPGRVSHTYFLLSDQANTDHTDYLSIYPASDTRYDQAAFHQYNSKLCKLNASDTVFYAVDTAGKRIVKYNYATGKAETVLSLSDLQWDASAYYGSGAVWNGCFTGLASFDGKLYYNTPSAIYSLDPSTKKTKKITGNSGSEEYYGLRIRGSQLYGVTAASPNTSGTYVELCKLEPEQVQATGITITPASLTLKVGESRTLTASVQPSDATDRTVVWQSTNSAVAAVTDGKVTARSSGTAVIVASTSNGKSAVCTVTVTEPTVEVTSVRLSQQTLSLYTGESSTLRAAVSPQDATDPSLTWSSSNKAAATVTNGKVTAVAAGTAVIKARSSNGKTASCTVTVTDREPLVNGTSINSDTVQVGDKVRIAASASGGSGGYTYAYYFKRKVNTAWKTLGTEFGTNSSVTFTPTSEAEYDVKVIVKDSAGSTAEKCFSVKAVETLALTNVSVISRVNIKLGTAIPMIGKAVGGTGPYTYAFYFKRSTNTNWKLLGEKFSATTTARLKPTAVGSYDIRIIVKDSTGKTDTKLMTATVS